MPQSYTNLIYHIVYSTKDRKPLITNDLQPRLYDYIGGMIRQRGGICLEIGGMSDHLHILAKLKPDKALSDVLRDLKANSTGWMHDVFPDMKDFTWQRGYGAFTVSSSQVENVRQYIANQEERHKKIGSFRDKFIKLLQANEIDFEEKYLWT